jgi:hypothetical protein
MPRGRYNRAPKPVSETPRMSEVKVIDTESPEFKAAVEKQFAELLSKHGAGVPASGDDNRDFMRGLALAIAEISDQGTSRKRVDPKILAARSEARERLIVLIVATKDAGIRPEYRLVAPVYFNEQLVQPYRVDAQTKELVPTEICWNGCPNDAMIPLCDHAKAIFAEYRASVGQLEGTAGTFDKSPAWVTAGGLMVKGAGPLSGKRQVAMAEHQEPMTVPNLPVFDDDLGFRNDDPRAKEVAVLGTVAPRAVQNAQMGAR